MEAGNDYAIAKKTRIPFYMAFKYIRTLLQLKHFEVYVSGLWDP